LFEAISEIFLETMQIILLVAVMMVIVEFIEIRFKNAIQKKITENHVNQIIIASLLGAIPGCTDAFFVVSLYTHGLVGFGALVAVMLSTAGDEAFVMLAMMPKSAVLIFGICALLGIIGGFAADKIAKMINLKTTQPCEISPRRRN